MVSLVLVLAMGAFYLPWKLPHPYFHSGQQLLCGHFTAPCNYYTPISLALALAICTFHCTLQFTAPQFHLHLHLPSAHFTAPCNLLHSNFTCTCTYHPHISLTLKILASLFSLGTALAICTFHCTLQFTALQFHLHLHLPSAHFTYLGNSCIPIFTWDSTCHLHISLHLA